MAITNDNVLIISPDYIKKSTPFLNDIDDQYIVFGILEAQRFWLLNVLGSKLFEQIKEEISTSTLTTENEFLIENYIVSILTYYAIFETMPYLRSKFTNKGILNQTSENSDTIDVSEFHELRTDIKNKAEFNTQRMLDYLCDNQSDYPLYFSLSSDEDGALFPNNKSYFSGIYLG